MRSEIKRLLCGIFSATCFVVAAIFVAVGHVPAAMHTAGWPPEWSANQRYWSEAVWWFVAAGVLAALGVCLALTAVILRSGDDR